MMSMSGIDSAGCLLLTSAEGHGAEALVRSVEVTLGLGRLGDEEPRMDRLVNKTPETNELSRNQKGWT